MGDYGPTGAVDLLLSDIHELKETVEGLKKTLAQCLEALKELDGECDSSNIRDDDGWGRCYPYLELPEKTRKVVDEAIAKANEVLDNG